MIQETMTMTDSRAVKPLPANFGLGQNVLARLNPETLKAPTGVLAAFSGASRGCLEFPAPR